MSQSFFFFILSMYYTWLTKAVRISSLSLSLSLEEHIASGEAQTGSQSFSRPKLIEPT